MASLTESRLEVEDAQLLRNFVERGDREALETIFNRHMDQAYRVALRCSRDAADAEDRVQSAFLSVIRCAQQYRGEASVKAWIMKIVVRACKDADVSEASRHARELRVAQPNRSELTAESKIGRAHV